MNVSLGSLKVQIFNEGFAPIKNMFGRGVEWSEI